LILGTRIAFIVAFPAVLAAATLGLLLGAIAAYGGRIWNAIVVVWLESFQALPAVILALTLLALYGPSLPNVVFVISIAFAPKYTRVVLAMILSIKTEPFIEAEQTLGASIPRIVIMHILPNLIPTLAVMVAMDLPAAIGIEAGLSFLGLGVQPPTPSWGVVLAEGFSQVRESPWPVLWASVILMLSTVGITFLGEAIRDMSDPKYLTPKA
jgi:peptide/nickel transport system permease protein